MAIAFDVFIRRGSRLGGGGANGNMPGLLSASTIASRDGTTKMTATTSTNQKQQQQQVRQAQQARLIQPQEERVADSSSSCLEIQSSQMKPSKRHQPPVVNSQSANLRFEDCDDDDDDDDPVVSRPRDEVVWKSEDRALLMTADGTVFHVSRSSSSASGSSKRMPVFNAALEVINRSIQRDCSIESMCSRVFGDFDTYRYAKHETKVIMPLESMLAGPTGQRQLLVIQAMKGMGKSKCIRGGINSGMALGTCPALPSVLNLTFRRVLARGVSKELGSEAQSYLDFPPEEVFDAGKNHVLTILINSLYRTRGVWDVLIIDEVVSVMEMLGSRLIDPSTQFRIVNRLIELVTGAKLIIIADAHNNAETLVVVRELILGAAKAGDWDVRVHDYIHRNKAQHRYFSTRTLSDWKHILFTKLASHQRVVVPSMTRRFALDLALEIRRRFPKLRVLCYVANPEEEIDMEAHMADVNSVWADADVLIYSPVITAGCSFEVENYYDCCMMYAITGCSTVGAAVQMTARVRSLRQEETIVYIDRVDDCFGGVISAPEEIITREAWTTSVESARRSRNAGERAVGLIDMICSLTRKMDNVRKLRFESEFWKCVAWGGGVLRSFDVMSASPEARAVVVSHIETILDAAEICCVRPRIYTGRKARTKEEEEREEEEEEEGDTEEEEEEEKEERKEQDRMMMTRGKGKRDRTTGGGRANKRGMAQPVSSSSFRGRKVKKKIGTSSLSSSSSSSLCGSGQLIRRLAERSDGCIEDTPQILRLIREEEEEMEENRRVRGEDSCHFLDLQEDRRVELAGVSKRRRKSSKKEGRGGGDGEEEEDEQPGEEERIAAILSLRNIESGAFFDQQTGESTPCPSSLRLGNVFRTTDDWMPLLGDMMCRDPCINTHHLEQLGIVSKPMFESVAWRCEPGTEGYFPRWVSQENAHVWQLASIRVVQKVVWERLTSGAVARVSPRAPPRCFSRCGIITYMNSSRSPRGSTPEEICQHDCIPPGVFEKIPTARDDMVQMWAKFLVITKRDEDNDGENARTACIHAWRASAADLDSRSLEMPKNADFDAMALYCIKVADDFVVPLLREMAQEEEEEEGRVGGGGGGDAAAAALATPAAAWNLLIDPYTGDASSKPRHHHVHFALAPSSRGWKQTRIINVNMFSRDGQAPQMIHTWSIPHLLVSASTVARTYGYVISGCTHILPHAGTRMTLETPGFSSMRIYQEFITRRFISTPPIRAMFILRNRDPRQRQPSLSSSRGIGRLAKTSKGRRDEEGRRRREEEGGGGGGAAIYSWDIWWPEGGLKMKAISSKKLCRILRANFERGGTVSASVAAKVVTWGCSTLIEASLRKWWSDGVAVDAVAKQIQDLKLHASFLSSYAPSPSSAEVVAARGEEGDGEVPCDFDMEAARSLDIVEANRAVRMVHHAAGSQPFPDTKAHGPQPIPKDVPHRCAKLAQVYFGCMRSKNMAFIGKAGEIVRIVPANPFLRVGDVRCFGELATTQEKRRGGRTSSLPAPLHLFCSSMRF